MGEGRRERWGEGGGEGRGGEVGRGGVKRRFTSEV